MTDTDPEQTPAARYGRVTLAPGITPDAAARAFWDAMERIGGERLERARKSR